MIEKGDSFPRDWRHKKASSFAVLLSFPRSHLSSSPSPATLIYQWPSLPLSSSSFDARLCFFSVSIAYIVIVIVIIYILYNFLHCCLLIERYLAPCLFVCCCCLLNPWKTARYAEERKPSIEGLLLLYRIIESSSIVFVPPCSFFFCVVLFRPISQSAATVYNLVLFQEEVTPRPALAQ